MDLSANITGISYTPYLCSELESFAFADLEQAFSKSAFILNIDAQNSVAVSWWVSAKRTRTYPYTRVYNTLNFSGKKITVIPIFKDEGKRGDRDFLQWDTVSLMSLLGVHVIIGYYADAERSPRYPNEKITKQRFDMPYIGERIEEILSYQSGPLHWNMAQVDNAGEIAQKALESYTNISNRLNVEMTSSVTAERRIARLQKGRQSFMESSRELADAAAQRETMTLQPKEQVSGTKGTITIQNYLGGRYYLTLDEVEITGQDIHLIEAKHNSRGMLPSETDIKDALIKMFLFTNLEDVKFEGRAYNPIPTMKLTGGKPFNPDALRPAQKRFWDTLHQKEAQNGFVIRVG